MKRRILGRRRSIFHLPRPRTGGGLAVLAGLAAQPLEQRHRPGRGLVHAVATDPRELHDFGTRHQAEHGVAVFAARFECGQDGADMVFEEKHRRDDDIAGCDVGLATFERVRGAFPVGGGVESDADPAAFAGKLLRGTLDRARQMIVEGDDDHPHLRGEATVHNAPSHHTACRG
jgi:hypothetical protein